MWGEKSGRREAPVVVELALGGGFVLVLVLVAGGREAPVVVEFAGVSFFVLHGFLWVLGE